MSIRRKIAGLIVVFGLLYIGARLLPLGDVELRWRLGDPSRLQRFEVQVTRQGQDEPTLSLSTELLSPDIVQSKRLKPGSYRADVVLVPRSGPPRRVVRTLEIERGSELTIDLRRDVEDATE
jgi:hypothetical protein